MITERYFADKHCYRQLLLTCVSIFKVSYEYLVVATGIQLAFDKVKGLIKALDTEGVCSNYSIHTASKTWECIQNFKEGNAIFTFPASPVKCPGAPQKIMYLAEDYFRKNGIRDKAKVSYISALPVIFGVPKYAERLSVVAAKRNIETVFRTHLVEIKPESKEAIFENLDTKALITRKVRRMWTCTACPHLLFYSVLDDSRYTTAQAF